MPTRGSPPPPHPKKIKIYTYTYIYIYIYIITSRNIWSNCNITTLYLSYFNLRYTDVWPCIYIFHIMLVFWCHWDWLKLSIVHQIFKWMDKYRPSVHPSFKYKLPKQLKTWVVLGRVCNTVCNRFFPNKFIRPKKGFQLIVYIKVNKKDLYHLIWKDKPLTFIKFYNAPVVNQPM